jgi:hypothetical protein
MIEATLSPLPDKDPYVRPLNRNVGGPCPRVSWVERSSVRPDTIRSALHDGARLVGPP